MNNTRVAQMCRSSACLRPSGVKEAHTSRKSVGTYAPPATRGSPLVVKIPSAPWGRGWTTTALSSVRQLTEPGEGVKCTKTISANS
jgi:hypothetical protein